MIDIYGMVVRLLQNFDAGVLTAFAKVLLLKKNCFLVFYTFRKCIHQARKFMGFH